MGQMRRDRLIVLCGLAVMVLLIGTASLSAQARDPVEELRQALPMRLEDMKNSTPAVLEFREETLRAKVDALRTISQLRRALMLEEWKEDPTVVVSDKLRNIDVAMRKSVGERLSAAIRDIVASGGPNGKLAVANLIAEMGPTVRALDPSDHRGYARSLTPEVIQLTREKDLAVRQEALRALGNINAPVEEVMAVFRSTLQKDSLGPRRLAADGLGQMVRVVNHLHKRGRVGIGIRARREDVAATLPEVISTLRAVIEHSMVGLEDEDVQVRALCLIAFQVSSQAVADQIADPFNKNEFPPEGRKLSGTERKMILEHQAEIREEMLDLVPGFQAIRNHAPRLADFLRDPRAASLVKLSAIQALESAANVRLRLRRRVLSVPDLSEEANDMRAFLEENDPLGPLIAKDLAAPAALLCEPETRLRRAGLDFLELLEEAAAPALPEVVLALGDPDRFVRWAAVRTLALLPPERSAIAAPQLAKLLADPDLNVRVSAAQALELMGSLAKEAAPALALAVSRGDVEPRIHAMYALQRLPPEAAQVAVPPLTDVLRHPEPRLRRAAAETLGKLGAVARPAIPALRRALGDEDAEVRVHASDAILNISTAK